MGNHDEEQALDQAGSENQLVSADAASASDARDVVLSQQKQARFEKLFEDNDFVRFFMEQQRRYVYQLMRLSLSQHEQHSDSQQDRIGRCEQSLFNLNSALMQLQSKKSETHRVQEEIEQILMRQTREVDALDKKFAALEQKAVQLRELKARLAQVQETIGRVNGLILQAPHLREKLGEAATSVTAIQEKLSALPLLLNSVSGLSQKVDSVQAQVYQQLSDISVRVGALIPANIDVNVLRQFYAFNAPTTPIFKPEEVAANLNMRETHSGHHWTLLHYAVYCGDDELVKYLLDHGALILKDREDRFPEEVPMWETVKATRSEGHARACTLVGGTAEQGRGVAKNYPWPNGYDFLSDVDGREKMTCHNWTPMHAAVHHTDPVLVRWLLAYGAKVELDAQNRRPDEVYVWSQRGTWHKEHAEACRLVKSAMPTQQDMIGLQSRLTGVDQQFLQKITALNQTLRTKVQALQSRADQANASLAGMEARRIAGNSAMVQWANTHQHSHGPHAAIVSTNPSEEYGKIYWEETGRVTSTAKTMQTLSL